MVVCIRVCGETVFCSLRLAKTKPLSPSPSRASPEPPLPPAGGEDGRRRCAFAVLALTGARRGAAAERVISPLVGRSSLRSTNRCRSFGLRPTVPHPPRGGRSANLRTSRSEVPLPSQGEPLVSLVLWTLSRGRGAAPASLRWRWRGQTGSRSTHLRPHGRPWMAQSGKRRRKQSQSWSRRFR